MDISDLPAFERDYLVELIEPVEVVGDEEHRAPGHRHAEPGQHTGQRGYPGAARRPRQGARQQVGLEQDQHRAR
jgi:hypothetical protein